MGEVVIIIDETKSSKQRISRCRICHEEEAESFFEVPCACSGTVKFAHRDCIQRWCNEKGNTTCEICLQVLFFSIFTSFFMKRFDFSGEDMFLILWSALSCFVSKYSFIFLNCLLRLCFFRVCVWSSSSFITIIINNIAKIINNLVVFVSKLKNKVGNQKWLLGLIVFVFNMGPELSKRLLMFFFLLKLSYSDINIHLINYEEKLMNNKNHAGVQTWIYSNSKTNQDDRRRRSHDQVVIFFL